MFLSSVILKRRVHRELLDMQRHRAEINNIPPIGSAENEGLFTQMQLNFAGVEAADSVRGLDASIGRAGTKHTDPQDCPLSYTPLFAMGNLDKFDIDPGRFHAAELGAYAVMVNYRPLVLNALHFHGGSPPRAKPSQDIPPQATRAVTIPYNNDDIASNTSASVFGATGARSHVDISNRARWDDKFFEQILQGPLNYLRDGSKIMSDSAFKTFIARQAVALLETLFRQTSAIRLNPAALAVLFLDGETEEVLDAISTWAYPAGLSAERRLRMKGIMDAFDVLKFKARMTMPSQLKKMLNKTIRWNGETNMLEVIPPGSSAPKRVTYKRAIRKKKGRIQF